MIESFDQANIYNKRYKNGYYGTSSPVPVLTSERNALMSAINRARKNKTKRSVLSVLDFGYGIGRVLNELLMSWSGPEDLNIVAYDVAAEGLKMSMDSLYATGQFIHKDNPTAYHNCLGIFESQLLGPKKRIVFMVATKGANIEDVLLNTNDGLSYDIVTAWYDVVSHAQSPSDRLRIFELLGKVTSSAGELIITASTIGDFNVDYGTETFRDLSHMDRGRDVIYVTETGDENFVHLYEVDFWQDMQATLTRDNQKLWLEPIRLLGSEYNSLEEERAAYEILSDFRKVWMSQAWSEIEYAAIHTVGGFRSGNVDR